MTRVGKLIIGGMLGALASPLAAQQDADAATLVAIAFDKAKAASPTIEIQSLSCSEGQRQIIDLRGAEMRFPCMLLELIENDDDAAMAVTLLLSDAPPVPRDLPVPDTPLAESAAAIGAVVAGAQLDGDTERKRIERHAQENPTEPRPSLATFLPRDSDTFRAEVERVDRQRRDERADQRARERAEEARREQARSEAHYRSVTDFLNLAQAQNFCPADGRAFLARAVQYATSPLDGDRMVGLWADDRRHALEAYLNDVSRCR